MRGTNVLYSLSFVIVPDHARFARGVWRCAGICGNWHGRAILKHTLLLDPGSSFMAAYLVARVNKIEGIE